MLDSKQSFRNIFLLVFKVTVTLGLMVYIFTEIDINKIKFSFKEINISYIFITFFILLTQTILASYRWFIVNSHLKIDLPFYKVIKYLWVGLFFNQALPSSIGGDAMKIYFLKQNKISLSKSTLTVLTDRLFGLLGLIILVVTSLIVLQNNDLVTDLNRSIFLVLIGLTLTFLMLQIFKKFLKSYLRNSVLYILIEIIDNFLGLLSDRSVGLKIFSLSIAIHLLSIFAVYFIALSIGENINIEVLLYVVPIFTFLMILPISLAGWGVRETIVIKLLPIFFIAPENAFLISIIYGLMTLLISLPGGIFWLTRE